MSFFYKKPINFYLIKLYYPFYDCNILVNFLGKLINKNKLRKLNKNLFRKAFVINPFKSNRKFKITELISYIRGAHIRVAGFMNSKRIVERKTVQYIRKGAHARSKVHSLDISRFTGKSKRGTFAITIKMAQNLHFSTSAPRSLVYNARNTLALPAVLITQVPAAATAPALTLAQLGIIVQTVTTTVISAATPGIATVHSITSTVTAGATAAATVGATATAGVTAGATATAAATATATLGAVTPASTLAATISATLGAVTPAIQAANTIASTVGLT